MSVSVSKDRVPPPLRTFKQTTSPITNNTTSASTDITGMVVSVLANHNYSYYAQVVWQTSVTTTGIGFFALTPAIADSDFWTCNIQQGGSGTDQMYQQSAGVFGSTLVAASAVAIDTNYYAKLEGFFTPTADGTVQLRFRTEVDTSEVRVMAGGRGHIIDHGI